MSENCHDLQCPEDCCNVHGYCPGDYDDSYLPEYTNCYYQYNEEEENGEWGITVGAIGGGVLMIIIVLLIVLCSGKSKTAEEENNQNPQEQTHQPNQEHEEGQNDE